MKIDALRFVTHAAEHIALSDDADARRILSGAMDRIVMERKRRQRNANARARYDAYRSCGMVRTPYGWE